MFATCCVWRTLRSTHAAFDERYVRRTLHSTKATFGARCIRRTLRSMHAAFDARYVRRTLRSQERVKIILYIPTSYIPTSLPIQMIPRDLYFFNIFNNKYNRTYILRLILLHSQINYYCNNHIENVLFGKYFFDNYDYVKICLL